MFPMEVDKFIEQNNQTRRNPYVFQWGWKSLLHSEMEPPLSPPTPPPPMFNASGFLWAYPSPNKLQPITCDYCGVVHLLESNRTPRLPPECPFCGKVGGEDG